MRSLDSNAVQRTTAAVAHLTAAGAAATPAAPVAVVCRRACLSARAAAARSAEHKTTAVAAPWGAARARLVRSVITRQTAASLTVRRFARRNTCHAWIATEVSLVAHCRVNVRPDVGHARLGARDYLVAQGAAEDVNPRPGLWGQYVIFYRLTRATLLNGARHSSPASGRAARGVQYEERLAPPRPIDSLRKRTHARRRRMGRPLAVCPGAGKTAQASPDRHCPRLLRIAARLFSPEMALRIEKAFRREDGPPMRTQNSFQIAEAQKMGRRWKGKFSPTCPRPKPSCNRNYFRTEICADG